MPAVALSGLSLLVAAGCSAVVAPDLGLPVRVEDPSGGLCVATVLSADDQVRSEQLDLLDDLGARAIRQDLPWVSIEPEPGAWDFARHDSLVDDLQASGIDLIGMLGYGVPWASSATDDDPYYPPDDPADFAAYAATMAERYDGRVDRWEIWNEPNAGFRFWKRDPPQIGGDPVGYAELFVAAARAIHAAAPAAEVMVGGTFFHEQAIPGSLSFLADAIAAEPELLDLADSVAWHPYTLYPPRVPPEQEDDGEWALWSMTAGLRGVVGDDLPLVITEVGWPSILEVSREEQASWLVREAALAQAEGVRDVCWYTLSDSSDFADNPEHAFGLYEVDRVTPKPAALAFQELARALDGDLVARGRAEEALGLPQGVLATRYTGSGRTLTILWTTDEAKSVRVPASSRASTWAEVGGSHVLVDGDGALVEVSPEPVLLLETLGER